MRPFMKLSAVITGALLLTGFATPEPILRRWGPEARPLWTRRIDLNLDGAPDRLTVGQIGPAVFVSADCHYPGRHPFDRWARCGGFAVAYHPATQGRFRVHRVQTGDLNGDGRTEAAVEVVSGDGLHHLAVGPLLESSGYSSAPDLALRARRFAIWDVHGDGTAEIVAKDLEGTQGKPSFVTFAYDLGAWRRSHGAALPPGPGRVSLVPLTRVPDVRSEPLDKAVTLLAKAGLRPGMLAAVDLRKGFRDVNALRPREDSWLPLSARVDLALAVPVARPYLLDKGEVASVRVRASGQPDRLLRPGDPAFADLVHRLYTVLAQPEQLVQTGGPPLTEPYGPVSLGAPTLIEFRFARPLRVRLLPRQTGLTVRRIAVPFTRYETGLLYLGSPDYRAAVTVTGGTGSLHQQASTLFPPPRELQE